MPGPGRRDVDDVRDQRRQRAHGREPQRLQPGPAARHNRVGDGLGHARERRRSLYAAHSRGWRSASECSSARHACRPRPTCRFSASAMATSACSAACCGRAPGPRRFVRGEDVVHVDRLAADVRDWSCPINRVEGPHAFVGAVADRAGADTAAVTRFVRAGRGGRPLPALTTFNTWFVHGIGVDERHRANAISSWPRVSGSSSCSSTRAGIRASVAATRRSSTSAMAWARGRRMPIGSHRDCARSPTTRTNAG